MPVLDNPSSSTAKYTVRTLSDAGGHRLDFVPRFCSCDTIVITRSLIFVVLVVIQEVTHAKEQYFWLQETKEHHGQVDSEQHCMHSFLGALVESACGRAMRLLAVSGVTTFKLNTGSQGQH